MCKICGRRPCLKGCPGAIETEFSYFCPICEEELATGDILYCAEDGEVIGCENCISRRFVQDVEYPA